MISIDFSNIKSIDTEDKKCKPIDLNGIRFYANINQLLIDKISLDQWVMILGAKMDIENEIDVFNRQGLFYQE